MQTISSLSAIIDRYDAVIMDLWGVIHDGSRLYPGVHAALARLRGAGKKIVMLSNAPRRARVVEKVLNQLGVEPALYDAVISSGEVGYQRLAASQEMGRRYYYIGPPKDEGVLDGLDYERTARLHEADFLLNVGFGSEAQSTQDWLPLLGEARTLKLPMICLNPDLEVVKQTGEHFPCAGVIAHAYQNLGGAVAWFGKPYAEVYEQCMQVFFPSPLVGEGGSRSETGEGVSLYDKRPPLPGPLPQGERGKEGDRERQNKKRVLAIGDSLETDMPGAKHFGIDAVLVTGGILKKYSPREIEAMCYELSLRPQYVMPALKW